MLWYKQKQWECYYKKIINTWSNSEFNHRFEELEKNENFYLF